MSKPDPLHSAPLSPPAIPLDLAREARPPVLPQTDLSYAVTETSVGKLLLAVRDDGRLVASVYTPDRAAEDAALQRLSAAVSPRILRLPAPLEEARRQLDDFLAGARTRFDLPLDLTLATDFQRQVLGGLRTVGYGQRTTYGALASTIDHPKAARAVGTALGANPLCIVIPCHRVLPQGAGFGGYAGGPDAKATLLTLESHVRP